jgi:uncharacterized protein with beta-barrel porin domain
MIAILLWINCAPVGADIAMDGNGDYVISGGHGVYVSLDGVNVIYAEAANHYYYGACGAPALTITNSAANTVTVNTTAWVHSDRTTINLAGGTLINRGTITGPGGIVAVNGISTLINYGTINAQSNSNRAVNGTAGDDTFTIYSSSIITGALMGMGGTDELILTGETQATMSTNWSANEFEKLTKNGTGTWIIPAGNSIGGITSGFNINQGTLQVDGSLYILDGAVNSGATLSGTGTIDTTGGAGSLIVYSGGKLAPGNSIGSMTINRDVYLQEGSILEIEVNTSTIDTLVVNGTLNLAGTLHVVDLSGGTITDGASYNFIDATAYTGQFAQITDDSAVLDFTVALNGQYQALTANRVASYSSHAHSRRQRGVAGLLDQALGNNQLGDLTGELDGLNPDQLRHELNRLTPSGSAAPIHTVFTNSQHFTQQSLQLAHMANSGASQFAGNTNSGPGQNLLGQLSDDPYALAQDAQAATQEEQAIHADTKLHFFASPFGQFGDIDSSDSRTGYDFTAYGAIIGLDYACANNCSLGFSLGYINTDIDLDQNSGNSNVNTLRFGPYATYTNGPWSIDASLTAGIHWVDANRETIMGTAQSDYNNYDITLYTAASYDLMFGQFKVTPTLGLTYIHQMSDSYSESGAGTANLDVDSINSDSFQSLLGVHVSCPLTLGAIKLTPEAWVGWQYEWLNRDIDINATFAAGPTTTFTSTSGGIASSQLVAGTGVMAMLADDLSLKFNYELNASSDATIHTIWAMIELQF